ncbi:MAG: cohesin domain-containing protein [Oscillospiraceae bacterium]
MKKFISTMAALAVMLMPVVSVSAVAEEAEEEKALLTVSSAEVKAGEDFTVNVDVSGNPGIIAMRFFIGYDSDVLELVSAEDAGLFKNADGEPDKNVTYTGSKDYTYNPYSLMWDSLSDGNYTDNGTIAVLHFHVVDTAEAGNTYISINTDDENIFDYDFNDIPFSVEYGEVTIVQEEEETTTTETTTTTAEETTTTEATETTTQATTTTVETTVTEVTTEEATTAVETTTVEETTTAVETTAVEETTTAVETTTVEETTTAVQETTTADDTTGYFASIDELVEMAKKDFETKNGISVTATATKVGNDLIRIELSNGEKVVSVYMIDPRTGTGTDDANGEVNLPQTGVTSWNTALEAIGAVTMTTVGAWMVVSSLRKKKDEE